MTLTSPARRGLAALVALPLVLGVAACGEADPVGEDVGSTGAEDADPVGEDAGSTATQDDETRDDEAQDTGAPLTVVTSFYPIEYLASRVAGEHAEISTLTSPGVDPHDVELTPRQVAGLGSADLVLYSTGMQPAVDQAVGTEAGGRAVDLAPHADLLLVGETPEAHEAHSHDDDHGHGHDDDEHHDDDHGHDDDHHGHDHGPEDPHFWLDPERYGQVAEAIAAELSTIDPDNQQAYEANLELLLSDLETLDLEFSDGLAECRSRDLVTTHEAFGYLAHRYDLQQVGITGIAPESEPSPARLAEVTALVRDLDVRTIFAEPILSDDIARTIATETGAQVLTLDPLEGIPEASAGTSYDEIMRANLEALRQGLECS